MSKKIKKLVLKKEVVARISDNKMSRLLAGYDGTQTINSCPCVTYETCTCISECNFPCDGPPTTIC